MANQNPEQIVRDKIDKYLQDCGWLVQDYKKINLSVGKGVVVREYPTEVGPADYILFIDRKAVGIIEAKREEEAGHLSIHESQLEAYANAPLKIINNEPLPFLYLSTGIVTKFKDRRDPNPSYREIFTFHRPETIDRWIKEGISLRKSMLENFPILSNYNRLDKLRQCQIEAITSLESSLKDNKPRALVQMATGSGKTFTAITSIYRLLKHTKAKRILFLVDTKNLGEQAEAEFNKFEPQDDNRLFKELYGVVRLTSSFIPIDNNVYISTIQRLYSILKGVELDEHREEENPSEGCSYSKEPLPVVYSHKVPIEFFDCIVIDECHRSIYNLWRQVLDYFDAFQIGLTATPDNRTFGYFHQNIVSDYGYEKAVIDGILVPYNVYSIETKITQDGATIEMGEMVDKRERLTRRKFWETVDEDIEYTAKQLDRDIVNPSTIRSIIQEVKKQLPRMFPDRLNDKKHFEVPKMLIFAKTDSHAEDIIEIVRDEFNLGSNFCKKITYQSKEDPKAILTQFRNSYYPRVAVTVDMIATGTDIKPLEILLFMRDVKSRSYYEQMKGRGTRTCSLDDLQQAGTPSAKYAKDHFVIIDAIGVEKSQKTDSRPLEKAPSISLKDLLQRVAVGDRTEDTMSTLANRLLRLNKQINNNEQDSFKQKAEGKNISEVVGELLEAHNPDTKESIESNIKDKNPAYSSEQIERLIEEKHKEILENAVAIFHNPDLREYLIDIRKKYDQIIDTVNIDTVVSSDWQKDQKIEAETLISDFKAWMEINKDEIIALQIFYNEPYRRKDITFKMLKDLKETILNNQPKLAPLKVWKAYKNLESVEEEPKDELMALVSLIRHIIKIDTKLISFDKVVDRNFQRWTFQKQGGNQPKFTEEQMVWLRKIKEHIANSIHIELDDLDYTPFDALGGRGKMYDTFGSDVESLINELNEVLTA